MTLPRLVDNETEEEEEKVGARYSCKQLQHFREISRCEQCAHYIGCPFWMTILLLNNEPTGHFMKMMLPSIEKPCLMFLRGLFARE